MKYELIYTRRALMDVQSLDTLVRKRIGRKILELQSEPLGKSWKLASPAAGTYRYRIGDYRVVFDIDKNTIVILRIGHRREIHR